MVEEIGVGRGGGVVGVGRAEGVRKGEGATLH